MRALVLVLAAGLAIACSHANPVRPDTAGVAGGSTDVVIPDLADHGGRFIEAALTPVTGTGSGLLRMSGNGGQGELCYAVRVDVTTAAISLHVHRAGVAAEAFSLLLPVNGYAAECREGLDRASVHDLLNRPGGYTAELTFASGAVLAGTFARSGQPYK